MINRTTAPDQYRTTLPTPRTTLPTTLPPRRTTLPNTNRRLFQPLSANNPTQETVLETYYPFCGDEPLSFNSAEDLVTATVRHIEFSVSREKIFVNTAIFNKKICFQEII